MEKGGKAGTGGCERGREGGSERRTEGAEVRMWECFAGIQRQKRNVLF